MTAVLITAAIILGGLFFTNRAYGPHVYMATVLLAALWGWNEVASSIVWPLLALLVVSITVATIFAEQNGKKLPSWFGIIPPEQRLPKS